jgi:NitT/TauT family transport system substrate-binding protein
VAYVYDKSLGIKVFADKAFYSMSGIGSANAEIVPFLLKKDAEAYAGKAGAKVASYTEALSTAGK